MSISPSFKTAKHTIRTGAARQMSSSRVGIAIPDLNFQSRDSGLSNSQSRDPGIPSGLA